MTADGSIKNLFDVARAEQLKQRIASLRSDSPRQWGKMSVAQTVAHCAAGMEMALGDLKPPRALIGRLIGGPIKRKVVGDDEPFRRNSPTVNALIIHGEPDLDRERQRLCSLIDRLTSGGPSACSTHPHPFFGSLTSAEWGIVVYKHLDHHLRQFRV